MKQSIHNNNPSLSVKMKNAPSYWRMPVSSQFNYLYYLFYKTNNKWNHNINWLSALLTLLIIFLVTPDTFAADDLGRLFTTPEQRAAMEKLRHQKPVETITVPEIAFEEPEVEEEKPVIGGITVNGLVYRKGGKSTAWINSANTFEGNFGNEYIQIDANNIKPDDVEIVIPINDKSVKLRAGDTYDPETDKTFSSGYQDN